MARVYCSFTHTTAATRVRGRRLTGVWLWLVLLLTSVKAYELWCCILEGHADRPSSSVIVQ